MENNEYKEYTPNKKINLENIKIGIGLNEVDNLKPSKYFYEALENSDTYDELEEKITSHYAEKSQDSISEAEKECDIVSQRIAKFIENEGFTFSPISLKTIHKSLFSDVFPDDIKRFVGVFRDINIFKKEEILGYRESVNYANHFEINEFLEYDFQKEKNKQYANFSDKETILNISSFVSNIWQTHPFREGNTRTIAVFAIKYLNNMGFDVNNDIFQEHSKYFRNALVLANYFNTKERIGTDDSYLTSFFEKLLIDKDLELKTMPKSILSPENKEKHSLRKKYHR